MAAERLDVAAAGQEVSACYGGSSVPRHAVIKEANLPTSSGTATGVVNFINFTFSALLGPVFAGLLMSAKVGAREAT